jgi:3-hydroxybutyryl-CoA dehydrogenase
MLGYFPYVVQRESMGFIFNRIWAAIKRETLAVVAEGVASAEVVDATIVRSPVCSPAPSASWTRLASTWC